MAFRANSYILSTAYMTIKSVAVSIKDDAVSAKSNMEGGAVSADYLLAMIDTLLSRNETLQDMADTPGLVAYAKSQEDDPTYEVVTEYQTVIAAMTAVVLWIRDNFPVSSPAGYLLKDTFNTNGSRSTRTFSSTATTPLVLLLDTLIATIE